MIVKALSFVPMIPSAQKPPQTVYYCVKVKLLLKLFENFLVPSYDNFVIL